MPAVVDDDEGRQLLSEHNIEQNDLLQHDQASGNNIMEHIVISLLIEKEQELTRTFGSVRYIGILPESV